MENKDDDDDDDLTLSAEQCNGTTKHLNSLADQYHANTKPLTS
jgi:hypothetical protein